jgi:hypothetical protein
MVTTEQFAPEFVEFVPAGLTPGVLYVSLEYATSSHLCACGCGTRVVTPLGRADWVLTFNGQVSLSPSIGNGQERCRSHYLIRDNRVVWCRPMSRSEAHQVHRRDTVERAQMYDYAAPSRTSLWSRIRNWLRRNTKS